MFANTWGGLHMDSTTKLVKLCTVLFDGSSVEYLKAYNILCMSNVVNTQYPLTTIRARIPDKVSNINMSYAYNTLKLRLWFEWFCKQQEGDRVALIDSDMAIMKPLDDAFSQQWDVAVTERTGRLKYNGGTVYLTVNGNSKSFLQDWVDINQLLYENLEERKKALEKHDGINQAALLKLLYDKGSEYRIKHLDCREWNCIDCYWEDVSIDYPRMIHLKGRLRKSLAVPLSNAPSDIAHIVNRMYSYLIINEHMDQSQAKRSHE